jgi:hypothetical protein
MQRENESTNLRNDVPGKMPGTAGWKPAIPRAPISGKYFTLPIVPGPDMAAVCAMLDNRVSGGSQSKPPG